MHICTDLRRADAARYLKEAHGVTISRATLAKMAVVGGGPLYCKDGKFPLYAVTDLDEWARSRKKHRARTTVEHAAHEARL